MFISSPETLLAAKQGLPVTLISGEQSKEGAPLGPGGGTLSIMDKQPHPNVAKVFVNWLLSKDGQVTWQREVGNNSRRVDIPKDTVAPVYQLKPGVKYVNAGVAEYAKLSGTVILDLLSR